MGFVDTNTIDNNDSGFGTRKKKKNVNVLRCIRVDVFIMKLLHSRWLVQFCGRTKSKMKNVERRSLFWVVQYIRFTFNLKAMRLIVSSENKGSERAQWVKFVTK